LPFVHTTVVPLLGGTTTVVLCAGGLGLPLLMQPASIDARISRLDIYLIVVSRGIVVFLVYAALFSIASGGDSGPSRVTLSPIVLQGISFGARIRHVLDIDCLARASGLSVRARREPG
jgi:hypothetical protein